MNSEQRYPLIYGTAGSVFHACLRQVCDSDPAIKAHDAISKMEDEWEQIIGTVAQEIASKWETARKNNNLFDMIQFNVGCGIHTSLRKDCVSEQASQAWNAIKDLPDEEWGQVVYWTAKRVYEEQLRHEQWEHNAYESVKHTNREIEKNAFINRHSANT